MGPDYDVGFPSFFGSVPEEPNGDRRAAALIGQGKVQASPLAMAAVVASVSAGKTVIPHLIDGQHAEGQGGAADRRRSQPAARDDACRRHPGQWPGAGRPEPPAVIAKTGHRRVRRGPPSKTHTWMIAAQDDLAVAVFVHDGHSGSKTAGPLLEYFLAEAR